MDFENRMLGTILGDVISNQVIFRPGHGHHLDLITSDRSEGVVEITLPTLLVDLSWKSSNGNEETSLTPSPPERVACFNFTGSF